MNPKPRVSPKDFFLYLGVTLSLYLSTIAFLALIFDIVNATFPDNGGGYFGGYSSSLRFELSSIIILFPIFLLLSWLTRRDIVALPEKREIWVRKWLSYLTLFLAGIAIIIDLITLLNYFLNGELTTRFILKVLAVIIVTAGIFGYYFFDLRKDPLEKTSARKTFAIISGIVVLASIIGAFVTVGSPWNQRLLNFDNQRVSDLQNIQYQIIDYWQRKAALPQKLSDLNKPLENYTVQTTDPEGKMYTYKLGDTISFELCADFDLPGGTNLYGAPLRAPVAPVPGSAPEKMNNDTWSHGAGETCFSRTIDTSLYPAFKK